MTIKQHLNENFHLAYPVMLSNLGHVAMGVTDNIMVGNLNATALAAAGLATVAFNVLLLFGIGVSYAITPLVATAHRARDDKAIVETLRHGFIINLLNSLLLVALVYVGKNILYYIGQPEEVVSQSIPFLSIVTFSLVPVMVFQTYKQFAEGLSNTRVAMIIVLVANVVNIALNYALVYGHGGFEAMGLIGSAWATFWSRMFMAVSIAAYIYYAREFRRFRAGFRLGNYSRTLFRKMLHIGVPSGAQFIFEVAAFDSSLVMMGWLGTTTQAAHQIVINLATVSYMTTAGLAAAATVRVSYFLGQRDIVNMKRAAYTLLAMALCVMAACVLFFILGRHWLPTLYVNDAAVFPIASSLLVVAGLFQLSDGTQVVCASALRGLQDVKVPSGLIFIAYWIIGLPLGYWLAFKAEFDAVGVWMGLFIGLTLTAIGMFARLKWQMDKLAVNG